MQIKRNYTPYLVGIGIGVLSWLTFVLVAKPIGISSAVAQIASWPSKWLLGGDFVANNAYWQDNPLKLDYGLLFVLGTFLGAGVSALVAKNFKVEHIPAVWQARFGNSKIKRYMAAFIGGMLVMYGARLAGGCTSGNGISQGLQLAVVGWTFFAVMFIVGLITAYIMFDKSK